MEKDNLKNKLETFVDQKTHECEGDECIIKTDKSLVELKKINKKIIIEDGRQLLT